MFLQKSVIGHITSLLTGIVSCVGVCIASGSEIADLPEAKRSITKVLTLKGHKDAIPSVAFSPKGRSLVSASFDGSVLLWDVPRGRQTQHLKVSGLVQNAWFTSAGDRVVCVSTEHSVGPRGSEMVLSEWDLATGRRLHEYRRADLWFSTPWTYDAAHNRFACGDYGDIRLLDHRAKRELRHWKSPELLAVLVFSQDGTYLVSCEDGRRKLMVWEVKSGTKVAEFKMRSAVDDAAFSPDGARLAYGLQDGEIGVIAIGSGKVLWKTKANDYVITLCYSPDGRHVLVSGLRTIPSQVARVKFVPDRLQLWDAAAGKRLAQSEKPVRADNIAFSQDGKYVAVSQYTDLIVFEIPEL